MKGGIEHRQPLSDAALAVLEQAGSLQDESDLIFPSPARPGRPLSDMAMTKLLRDVGLADRATVHGFRSSFRDWASECTDAPHAVMGAVLGAQGRIRGRAGVRAVRPSGQAPPTDGPVGRFRHWRPHRRGAASCVRRLLRRPSGSLVTSSGTLRRRLRSSEHRRQNCSRAFAGISLRKFRSAISTV